MVQHAITILLALLILFATIFGALFGKISQTYDWVIGGVAAGIITAAGWGWFEMFMRQAAGGGSES